MFHKAGEAVAGKDEIGGLRHGEVGGAVADADGLGGRVPRDDVGLRYELACALEVGVYAEALAGDVHVGRVNGVYARSEVAETRLDHAARVTRVQALAEDRNYLQRALLDHALSVAAVEYFSDPPDKPNVSERSEHGDLTATIARIITAAELEAGAVDAEPDRVVDLDLMVGHFHREGVDVAVTVLPDGSGLHVTEHVVREMEGDVTYESTLVHHGHLVFIDPSGDSAFACEFTDLDDRGQPAAFVSGARLLRRTD